MQYQIHLVNFVVFTQVKEGYKYQFDSMKKLAGVITTLILLSFNLSSQAIQIIESGGWFEKAYVKWQATPGINQFIVYYSGEGITDRKIDDQLIRNYGTYFRADIPGLKAGTYTIKVAPISEDDSEGTASTTPTLTVRPHERMGFAFVNGRNPGAYKPDGTARDNAVIIYITENTKNTVSLNVTGANVNPCVGLQSILDGFKRGRDTRPLIIRMIGQISDPTFLLKGDIVIENNNNPLSFITLEGIGDDAVADGWGIRIKNAVNIEIRNIATMNTNSDEGDNISLQQNNEYIWVHHCDFFYGAPGSASDQAKGDGALDSKESGFVTFSYNHFWDTGKANLLGVGTETPRFLTYHHNWYDHSDSRHPRVRTHSVHVFNNYYDGISKYGVGATNASSVFVESNFFRNCRFPMLISMQGSDVWSETRNANDYTNMPTFSGEDGGIIKAFNNHITGAHRFVPFGSPSHPNSTVDFDAVVVSSRNELVGSGIRSFRGANSYNNFDTNSAIMYQYTADSPEVARDKAVRYAGRMHGGDFKWTFNNAVDDNSSAVNIPLRNALSNYRTKLVSVQGEGNVNSGGGGSDPGDNNPVVPDLTSSINHNFTAAGLTSTFFSITGNLSTTRGTVTYAGQTLTRCLKIESVTSISFNTTESTILTLVFNANFNGRIRINGIDRTASAGILTITLAAGNHQIIKRDVADLFFMSLSRVPTSTDNTAHSGVKIYPNPTTDWLFIQGDAQIKRIEIINLSGAVVERIHGNIRSVNLGNFAVGTYLVRIVTLDGITTHRLIKR